MVHYFPNLKEYRALFVQSACLPYHMTGVCLGTGDLSLNRTKLLLWWSLHPMTSVKWGSKPLISGQSKGERSKRWSQRAFHQRSGKSREGIQILFWARENTIWLFRAREQDDLISILWRSHLLRGHTHSLISAVFHWSRKPALIQWEATTKWHEYWEVVITGVISKAG